MNPHKQTNKQILLWKMQCVRVSVCPTVYTLSSTPLYLQMTIVTSLWSGSRPLASPVPSILEPSLASALSRWGRSWAGQLKALTWACMAAELVRPPALLHPHYQGKLSSPAPACLPSALAAPLWMKSVVCCGQLQPCVIRQNLEIAVHYLISLLVEHFLQCLTTDRQTDRQTTDRVELAELRQASWSNLKPRA